MTSVSRLLLLLAVAIGCVAADRAVVQPSGAPASRRLASRAAAAAAPSLLQPTAEGVQPLARPLSRLRGGKAEAEDEPPLTRLRLSVAAGRTDDPSVVELSAADAATLSLESGTHVTLRGRKQRRTTCVALVSDDVAEGEARLSQTSLTATHLNEAQDVIVAAEPDLAEAERVLLLPFQSSLDAFSGSADDAFEQGLAPYLKGNDRPLTVGDIVETPVGEGDDAVVIRWKVMELEPEAANPIEAARGFVGEETLIFAEGDPLGDKDDHSSGADDLVQP